MLEIGFVERARRQQHHPRMIGARQAQQRFPLRPEKWRQTPDIRGAENIRQHIRHDGAVLQRIAGAGRRLRAIRQHPPMRRRASAPDRLPADADRNAAGPRRPPAAAETRDWQTAARRKIAVGDQPARAVNIFEKQVEQLRALNDAALRCSAILPAGSAAGWDRWPRAGWRPAGRCRCCK